MNIMLTVIMQIQEPQNTIGFLQDNHALIKSILINSIYFIIFLIILNLISRRIKVQIETIERNTEYMKQDFRQIKQEIEKYQELYNENKKNTNSFNNFNDMNKLLSDMLLTSTMAINNEFITFKKNNLQLTSMGFLVVENVNIENIINENWQKIGILITEYSKTNKHIYDVEKYCLSLGSQIDYLFSTEQINLIKKYAFEKGHIITSYYIVIGIVIRDRFFKEYVAALNKNVKQ